MSDKSFKIVRPLKTVLSDDLDEVSITIYHSTGGTNFATYKQERCGWYINFSPVHVERKDGWESTRTILFHEMAFRIRCCDGERFSAKKLSKLADVLRNNIDTIVDIYEDKDKEMLYEFVQLKFRGVK